MSEKAVSELLQTLFNVLNRLKNLTIGCFLLKKMGLKNYTSLLLFSIVITLMLSYEEASAEIFYPITNARHDGPPTYCIYEPLSGDIPYNITSKYTQTFKEAVEDWSAKLEKTHPSNNDVWEMNAVIIPKEETSNKEINCDIPVDFIFQSVDPYASGRNYDVGFSKRITMTLDYYIDPSGTCKDNDTYLNVLQCDEGIYYYDIRSFFDTAQHVIGHSFGLSHFFSDNEVAMEKWLTTEPSPSIMIPAFHDNPLLFEITDLDLERVYEIYAEKGFYAFSNEEENTSLPIQDPTTETAPKPIVPVFPFESTGIFNTNNEKIESEIIHTGNTHAATMIKVSGVISEYEFLKGVPVYLLILKPDGTAEIQKIKTTKDGLFETYLIFDRISPLGFYRIQPIYLENSDSKMNIFFTVVAARL